MIQDLKKYFDEIERLSNSLKISTITSKDKVDLREYLQELAEDIETLKINVKTMNSKEIREKELLTFLIATLNTSLVDLLSDIENIYEILVIVAKKYSAHLK